MEITINNAPASNPVFAAFAVLCATRNVWVPADEVNEYAAAFRAFGLSPQGGALSDDNARMLLYI